MSKTPAPKYFSNQVFVIVSDAFAERVGHEDLRKGLQMSGGNMGGAMNLAGAGYFCLQWDFKTCDPARLLERGFRAIGQNRKNIGFGLPPENGKNLAENREMSRKPYFGSISGLFSYFSAISSLISGRPKPILFQFFPISGRRPENPVLAGGQGRKSRPMDICALFLLPKIDWNVVGNGRVFMQSWR